MSIGIERLADELGAGGRGGGGRDTGGRNGGTLVERLAVWEDLLTLVVDPESARVADRARKLRLLSFLLSRAKLAEEGFWRLGRSQRGRLFLSRYSRVAREIPELGITSFDLDKILKERFRHEPLTVGAAWHHGYWRSYFSHAAITHPANDGLREEFSTAWDIARRHPAVLFRTSAGLETTPLTAVRLDMPMIVGPLPHTDGVTIERAYLEAVAAADPENDLFTRTLVVVLADQYVANAAALSPHAVDILLRLEPRHVESVAGVGAAAKGDAATLRDAIGAARIVELAWSADFERHARAVLAANPRVILSVFLRYGDEFWDALESAVRHESVAMIHYDAGPEKAFRLTPRVDAFLKARLLRARVQLVCAGGDADTQASAATVYESVLLGANGGAMTHVAGIALLPELTDVYHGAPAGPALAALAGADRATLRDLAVNTLTCWQHSILDFLSCMGIDDIQKTSGNTMAITMTEDWLREVDRLATPEFGCHNAGLNTRRVEMEPPPRSVRETYRVSALLAHRTLDLPSVLAARILAHESANYHVMNTNRNLTADFLEVIYRMAAGEMPRVEDFFVEGDMGPVSLDAIGLRVSRVSVEWSLARLARDPSLLDYVSLAVARGFRRGGAMPARADVSVHAAPDGPALASFAADARGGFEERLPKGHPLEAALAGERSLWMRATDRDGIGGATLASHGPDGASDGAPVTIELLARSHGAHGRSVARASQDGAITVRRDPRGGVKLSGFGFREPIWHGPVSHASISLGAASEDFLMARIEGNAGLAMTSSGEGGPIRFTSDETMKWESLQAASGHFGIHAADLRRVRDVEIKINQGAKPGKGGRLSGAKVTATVSKARNIPIGTDALSPDPKHDIYSIEDMPAEVWLWLLYHNHVGIKITGSNYTKYVAAGMWSNFVVDYLLIDSGLGGSGNYHADSSHVGWPDIFRTILHTHHALVSEKVDLAGSGELRTIRDLNGAPFGAGGGTRLFASGGLRSELDMVKVLIAGADGLVEASIGKAVAFGCNQCGNCHLDCPRGGITTKPELTMQNDRDLMRQRFRNWTVLNMVKIAVLIDAINRETGVLDESGRVTDASRLIDDIRKLRGRTDLLTMPAHPEPAAPARVEGEHDSCRVGSLAVSEPVTVHAIWEAACRSFNGGNNRGGGIDFAGFAPATLRDKTCLVFNTIGPDRADTMREMLGHLAGCRFFDASGRALAIDAVRARLDEFRIPVREKYADADGWRRAGIRENPGDFTMLFVALEPEVLGRYGRALLASERWLQRRTKYGDVAEEALARALREAAQADGAAVPPGGAGYHAAADAREVAPALLARLAEFVADVREEYFTALAHLLDTRYYRTHAPDGCPAAKFARKRRGFVVSMGEDLAAIKMSGWTHAIPEYFDFDGFWGGFPGARDRGGVDVTVKGRAAVTPALHAHVWGMHHRYPTNSPAIDAEGRGNPAGAHPFKAYNVLLMHNGEQVGVDSTAPFLGEFGFVHADESMGPDAALYHGDSVYERKALTDTEYAAYLVDFTRRVLGLPTELASQIISPITGLDLAAMDEERRKILSLLMTNYVQLTPTGPYKFTIVETRRRAGGGGIEGGAGASAAGTSGAAAGGAPPTQVVGFRENMDIKFLRPHEIVVSADTAPGGVRAVANGSEAKIADSMLRVLHQQGVLGDAAADLRFSMRPGGNPERRDFGGVFEAFTAPGSGTIDLRNRFGESVAVERSGTKVDLSVPLEESAARANTEWRQWVDERLARLGREFEGVAMDSPRGPRLFGPDDALPAPAEEIVAATLARAATLSFDDYRALVERALPSFARESGAHRAAALRILTELRKRIAYSDLGGKSLSSMEYLTDGGRAADGSPEGGINRLLDDVAPLHDSLAAPAPAATAAGAGRYGRLTLDTRDDLAPPTDAARDVLVIDFAGFLGESFGFDSASRIVSEAARLGWRNIIGYDFTGGPRYVGTNLAQSDGVAAPGVTIELYGREFGDFLGALLEGAQIWIYGQGQSHLGMKADSGYLFVLQDALNTCMYAAHGGTISLWDSGSRFAVAGQNKVTLADGKTPAPGFKSIHFGSPNEYAFEYLMSGGDNSFHVVMGLAKPDARGELSLRSKPYGGKFFKSGAAAGRVFVFDPERRLDPAQYRGNVSAPFAPEEWSRDVGPFVAREARRRGAPVRVEGGEIAIRLAGAWRRWRYDEAFVKLIPLKIAKAEQQKGVVPPQLVQIVTE